MTVETPSILTSSWCACGPRQPGRHASPGDATNEYSDSLSDQHRSQQQAQQQRSASSVDSERQDVAAYAVRRMVESMDQSGNLLVQATTSTGIDLRDDAHNDEDTIEQACETIGVDNATQIASNDSQAMISLRDGRSDMPEYALAEHHALPAKPQGWARRPHHGSTYGSDYMGPYRERVEDLSELGVENSSHKMGPGAMRAHLEKEFPGRSCLPSEEGIKLLIGQLSTQQKAREQAERLARTAELAPKDAAAAAVIQSGSSGRGRKGMEAKSASEIQLLTVTNPSKTPKQDPQARPPSKTPKQIMQTFLDQHVEPKPASFPTETQVKAKFVNVKTKYRKMQAKPTNNDI